MMMMSLVYYALFSSVQYPMELLVISCGRKERRDDVLCFDLHLQQVAEALIAQEEEPIGRHLVQESRPCSDKE